MSSMTSDKDSKKAGNRLSMDVKNQVKNIDKVRHLALLVGSSGPPSAVLRLWVFAQGKTSMSSDAGSNISDGFAASDTGGLPEVLLLLCSVLW